MRKPLFRLTLAVSLAVCALSLTRGPLGSTAAWSAAPALDEAQKLYDGAQFSDAITKLRDAISTGAVSGPDALKAKELLGRCLVKAGNRVEAKEQFKNLLRQDSGYRLDAISVPPDEMEVFNLALKEVQAEQIEAGQRVPASIALYAGFGSGASKDLAEVPHAGGGKDAFESQTEFGGSVRFPLRPRLSLDIELTRFRATNSDSFPIPNKFDYETTAIPLAVSLYWTALPHEHWRVNIFAGGGPMMATRAAIKFNEPGTGYFVADEKVGTYLHGGIEGEWLVSPRFSVNGRVLGRLAKASGLYKDSEIELYFPNQVPLKDREVNFSGFGAFIGLRAYIGY